MAELSCCPARKLFVDGNECSHEDILTMRVQEEAREASRKSMEKLQLLYCFDPEVITEGPGTSEIPTKTVSEDGVHHQCVRREFTEPRSHWLWEEVRLSDQYIPSFYYKKMYHSDSQLHLKSAAETSVPRTPYKTSSTICDQHLGSQSNAENNYLPCFRRTAEYSKAPNSARSNKKLTTLAALWNARVRRNSCTNYSEENNKSLDGGRPKREVTTPGRTSSSERITNRLKNEIRTTVPQNTLAKGQTNETRLHIDGTFLKPSSELAPHRTRQNGLTDIRIKSHPTDQTGKPTALGCKNEDSVLPMNSSTKFSVREPKAYKQLTLWDILPGWQNQSTRKQQYVQPVRPGDEPRICQVTVI